MPAIYLPQRSSGRAAAVDPVAVLRLE